MLTFCNDSESFSSQNPTSFTQSLVSGSEVMHSRLKCLAQRQLATVAAAKDCCLYKTHELFQTAVQTDLCVCTLISSVIEPSLLQVTVCMCNTDGLLLTMCSSVWDFAPATPSDRPQVSALSCWFMKSISSRSVYTFVTCRNPTKTDSREQSPNPTQKRTNI